MKSIFLGEHSAKEYWRAFLREQKSILAKYIASTKNLIPSKYPCEKDTYAHYYSYATLVNFVAYVGFELF